MAQASIIVIERLIRHRHKVKSAITATAKPGLPQQGIHEALPTSSPDLHLRALWLAPSQEKGIGFELVRRIMESLKDMYAVDIVCDEVLVPFYEKLGFGRCVGMVRRKSGKQELATVEGSHQ